GYGARESEIDLLVEGLKAQDLDSFEFEQSPQNVAKRSSVRHNLLGSKRIAPLDLVCELGPGASTKCLFFGTAHRRACTARSGRGKLVRLARWFRSSFLACGERSPDRPLKTL